MYEGWGPDLSEPWVDFLAITNVDFDVQAAMIVAQCPLLSQSGVQTAVLCNDYFVVMFVCAYVRHD